jgi:hypothetical protein
MKVKLIASCRFGVTNESQLHAKNDSLGCFETPSSSLPQLLFG